ncbi:MAG: NADH-quinone oxidoreductase subunit NuoH, partial [Bacteroidota bacterium]
MTILALDLSFVIEKLIMIAIVVLASLGIALYTTFAERKVAAILQDRPGPSRVGPFGLLQPLADGLKLIMKEEIIPSHANKWLFILGPGLAMTASLMTCAV